MIAFVFGGFGGVTNAAYAMNAMVQHGLETRTLPRHARCHMLSDTPCAHPAYLRLGYDALASRARRAVATLADCRACPRDCGVNRLEDRWAV